MKEMEYITDNNIYIEKRKNCGYEVLEDNVYEGVRYIILSYFSHPCAYLVVPKHFDVDKFEGKIDVNGGITYNQETLFKEKIYSNQKVIGWDYGHCWDYSGLIKNVDGQRHTTKSIIWECESAIRAMKREGLI